MAAKAQSCHLLPALMWTSLRFAPSKPASPRIVKTRLLTALAGSAQYGENSKLASQKSTLLVISPQKESAGFILSVWELNPGDYSE